MFYTVECGKPTTRVQPRFRVAFSFSVGGLDGVPSQPPLDARRVAPFEAKAEPSRCHGA